MPFQTKIDEYEKVISEHQHKHSVLEGELESFKVNLEAGERREEALNSRVSDLENKLKASTERCCHLENALEKAKKELVNELKAIGQDEDGNFCLYSGIEVLIKQVNSLLIKLVIV